MDTNANTPGQRKRTSRPLKGSPTDTTMELKESVECSDVAALSISPIPAIIPVSECRRSSRKKIIKFDVRDLLNKNRKPHKIQIEARIDSNVPSTSKSSSAACGETSSNSSGPTAGASGDLSSKQKTFMEKSAIFRRFSISQEQTKPPPPPLPMPPTMLSKAGEKKDQTSSADLSGKRINRTQEFYSNVMLKPKQTTSLIVAQMESNVRSVDVKRKSFTKTAGGEAKSSDSQEIQLVPQQQKRRGRPPKARQQELSSADAENEDKTNETPQKLTPEKATNWKEYKACLAQQSDVDEPTLSKDTEELTANTKESITVQGLKSSNSQYDQKECLDLLELCQIERTKADKKSSEHIECQKQDNNEILELPGKHLIQSENNEYNTENPLQSVDKCNEVIKQADEGVQPENLHECRISSPEITTEDLGGDKYTPKTTDSVVQSDKENIFHSEKEAISLTGDFILQSDAEKEIGSISGESTNKNEVPKEKSITLRRVSSMSESENSDPSSSSSAVALTLTKSLSLTPAEKIASVKSSPKEIMSLRSSPDSKDEEKKMPATKRSKRLQRKNNRAENEEPLCKSIDDCFEKIQTDEKENESTQNDNLKQADEINTPTTESVNIAETSIQSSFESIGENEEISPVSKPEGNENSSSDSSSTSESKITESKGNIPISEVADLKIDAQPSKENIVEKCGKIEQPPHVLDTNEFITSENPKSKENVDEDSAEQPHRHELDKTEPTDCQKQSICKSIENVDDKFDSVEQPHQELDKTEYTDCQKSSTCKSIENVDGCVLQLTQELDKNDSNDCQKTPLTSKSKVKVSTIQRKSLRNRKDNNKFDIETDKHVEAVQKTENEGPYEKDEHLVSFEEVPELNLPQSVETKEQEIEHQKLEEEGATKEQQVNLFNNQEESRSPSVDVRQSSGCTQEDILIATTVVCEIEENLINAIPSKDLDSTSILNSITIDCKEHESELETSTTTAKKLKPIAEKPTSAKRKSLRNQKECSHEKDDNEKQAISLEVDNVITQTDECSLPSNLVLEELIEVPKRKPRKSRFKNLHGPEDTETEIGTIADTGITTKEDLNVIEVSESSESKQIEETNREDQTECTSRKENTSELHPTTHNEENDNKIEESTETVETTKEHIANHDAIKDVAEDFVKHIEIVEQTASNNSADNKDIPSTTQAESTNSYVIKNVSIETNTLLDILRTVQSNKEAAQVEAQKTSDSVSELHDSEALGLHDPEELGNKNQDNTAKDMKLKKLIDNSNSNSPNRSDSVSPLTLKKSQNSPCRSDSSSPLTLKKVNISPSRSDTSSPLTFNKKVTRRYERRSRRGDDESTHKTLEETFAEIAALSSKAVLEMSIHETDIIEEPSANICSKGNEGGLTIDENKEISGDIVKTMPDSDIKLDNENEAEEFIEVTPTRKTRQPKTRSLIVQSPSSSNSETAEIKENLIQDSCKEPPDMFISKFESAKLVPDELVEAAPITEKKYHNMTPHNDTNISSYKDPIMTSSAIDSNLETCIESSHLPTMKNKDEAQVELPTEISILLNIQQISKSSEDEKIQDGSDEIALEDNSKTEILAAAKIEEGAETPKPVSKKRDSSLPKSETKGCNKKSSKKIKNSENIESGKTEDSTIKISTSPPKRGRKTKTTQQEKPTVSTGSSCGKKKQNKEQSCENKEEGQTQKDVESDSAAEVCLTEKSFDEKIAKKKRQRKLKEAFEAALNDKPVELKEIDTLTPSSSPTFGLSYLNKSPPPHTETTSSRNSITSETPSVVTTAIEPEEDPDPLKDIEKFIEDGVNLLKKGYKLDEDSVDNVIPSNTSEDLQEAEIKETIEDEISNKEVVFHTFETPADTPLTTPSATPPPKSPESAVILCEEQTSGGVRRSHRIKLITNMPKALVGRGLVRDKERFSIKDDVETKSHYTLDDHLLDLAEVEAKNAKFLKEMEERLSNFHVIKENEYKCERVISKEARKMICDCFLTAEEEGRGELACGEDCLNRLLMIECGTECNVKERCTNKRFQKFLCSPCRVFRTEKKGFGIMADIEILPGEFIMEYVGEVINTDEFERRRIAYSQEKNRHYYFMALRSDAIIDATIKGNISRFINHSCDPNAETQKWTVNGELRIGFFSRKSIMPGEEITFDYQYQRYGREAQRCYCESANCRGWIGQEPNSDEGEQIDDDDESDDEEDEDTSNLLEEDDEDSDASVSDPEEVQKKLEMAAAQAEAELAPITLDEKANEKEEETKEKEQEESIKPGAEEDCKSKFKKLLSKMAEKVAAKHKQNKREQKLQRKKKSKDSSSELANKQRSLEDPDIEDEVEFLSRCGLKTQSDTLRLSRLMVRAKLVQTRLNLLDILRKGELPCRRLFLDYHGLRLVHGWMSEDAGNMQIRLALLQTLELLPIANKTVLTDSKVMQGVRNWCGSPAALSPNDDSLSSNSNSQDGSLQPISSDHFHENAECVELQKLALKLITTWDGLPEIFRIPKKERIEQMKEHEREADRQYAETEGDSYSTDGYRSNRFGRRFNTTSRFAKPNNSKQLLQQNIGNTMRTPNMVPENSKCLSKTQRREMFAAKVARDEAEKRMAEERREFETKCRFFGLDPKKTRPQDVPFCVNPATGQWYSVERKPITTPPSYAHVQVPVKPKSTNPVDYQLPAVCGTLPPQWKFAITPLGQIYYYHVQYRVPQWEPPSTAQLQLCEINIDDGDSGNEHTPTTGPDSSDDDDEILIGMDAAQLKAYIDRKVEIRRQKRYQRLVDERAISPRREEDRMYNQLEVRKYKENKEKIRKRKEEIRRKRAEALRQSSLNMCTLGSLTDSITNSVKIEKDDDNAGVLPIQDYLLSSDEDDDIKAEVNSPLIDKIVEGDKIVDELDALTTKRPLKRPLPPHRDLNEPSPSSSSSASVQTTLSTNERQEYKKRKLEKKDKRKPKEQDVKYRRTKEKFRCEIAGIIVHHLKPYRKDTCGIGRIKSNDDFNHLARKLTHFVMIKELKYCESVGQTLVVTESVKNKSREFIKKYMAKYGDVYVKPVNDPEFKDIPFTL